MRVIDGDALLERVWSEKIQAQAHGREFSTCFMSPGGTPSTEWWYVEDLIENAPTIEPERKKWSWHKTDEDDLATFPDDDRMVLVSFSNFSLPMLGRWQLDEYLGGAWYQGDMNDTFVEDDLFVDGWWELPEKLEEEA